MTFCYIGFEPPQRPKEFKKVLQNDQVEAQPYGRLEEETLVTKRDKALGKQEMKNIVHQDITKITIGDSKIVFGRKMTTRIYHSPTSLSNGGLNIMFPDPDDKIKF